MRLPPPSQGNPSKNSSPSFVPPKAPETLTSHVELVIDAATGEVRQAGTSAAGQVIEQTRREAERSLYFFGKVIMGYDLLSPTFHLPECNRLQAVPPRRKLVLWPRGHLKTTILKAMALHMLIQPDGTNAYFPTGIGACGHSQGSSTRILFASKTAGLAQDTIGEIALACEQNKLLRALWPHAMWDNPRKEAPVWNRERLVLPRRDPFKEASIETVGVGGQITGYHFNVHIFDDLIDIESANSPTIMQTALDWWKTSRALMDDYDKSLEFTVGTRWAVGDLYEYIQRNDPSVDCSLRRIVEDGEPIFPERISLATVAQLQRENPERFPLLYMNNATDPTLTDFVMSSVRRFFISKGQVCFDEGPPDMVLAERARVATEIATRRSELPERFKVGRRPLDQRGWDVLVARNEYLKLRHPRVE